MPAFAGMTAIITTILLSACAETQSSKLALEPVGYSDLPGWQADRIAEAVPALQRSCNALKQKPQWQATCSALADVTPGDDAAARIYFEKWFQPYAVNDGDEGLFTGYYEAELHGSWKRGGKFQTPLYARPHDLVTVDLGDFEKSLKGKHIEGKVVGEKLKPYDARTEIENNGLQDRADVLLWTDDAVDAFFLAIQGSGRVIMDDGNVVHVGYAAPNGRDYVAIGRVMAEAGDIEKPVTMQKIRAWLMAHPDRAQAVMNENPSYVFFRVMEGEGPVGAEGVALTPHRSLAVDPAYVSLGTPVWLDTTDGNGARLQCLMVAQDTGGAIKGAVRGDFFWGYGPDAEAEAGAMQSRGRYYVLFPKAN